jgi:hypothetical protein
MRGGRSATRLEVELPSHGRAMPFAPPDEVMLHCTTARPHVNELSRTRTSQQTKYREHAP